MRLSPRWKLLGLLVGVAVVSACVGACVGAWVVSGPDRLKKIGGYLAQREMERKARIYHEKLRQDAEAGNVEAQFWHGFRYFSGSRTGTDKETNKSEAVKWFGKAAEQNYAPAQRYLASCYYAGVGVKKDFVEAYAWVELAATSGNSDYDYIGTREHFEKAMNPEQIAAAKKRAEELRAQIAAKLKSGGK